MTFLDWALAAWTALGAAAVAVILWTERRRPPRGRQAAPEHRRAPQGRRRR